jgi:UDP-glucose 4-epimerase
MRIAVAGASGFVGSHLVDYLVHQNLPHKRLTKIDLQDSHINDALADCDVVVNCIGEKSGIGPHAEMANIVIPKKLYTAAQCANVRQFVHVSSVAAIAGKTYPGLTIDDSSLPSPSTAYGLSKFRGDEALSSIDGPPLTILRPPILIGSNATGVFALLQKAAKTGIPLPLAGANSLRSFMHVDNFAEAICAAIRHNVTGRYIVTDSRPISSQDLYIQMLESAGFGPRVFTITSLGRVTLQRLLGRRGDSLFASAAFDGQRFIAAALPVWPIDPARIVQAAMVDLQAKVLDPRN